MKNLIFTFVAFLRAAADFIQENSGSAEAAATPNGEGAPAEPPAPKKRGPKPKTEPVPENARSANEMKGDELGAPVEVKTYTVEELKAICDPLIKAGGVETEFLREQIKAHGGTAISKIPVENHAAFVAAVQPRVLALPKGEEFE